MVSLKKSNHPLTTALQRLFTLYLPDGGTVCIGFSGGMDSSSLLHAALPLRQQWQLGACHVNHGISQRANQWELFCRQMSDSYSVPLVVHREKPSTTARTEEWARDVRLRAFASLQADAIILAHHAEDQAETVLFRLLRGAGVHGMAAMRPQTPLSGKMIIRPWLDKPRRMIADYAITHRLRWIEDEDNRNLSRRRNFLRWRGLSVLAEDFPQCSASLVAAGQRMQDSSALLLQLAEMDEVAAQRLDSGLSIAYFRQIGEARTRNWLYRALLNRRKQFSERHVAEAARQIIQVTKRYGLCFDFQGLMLRSWRDYLYWDENTQSSLDNFRAELKATAGRWPLAALGGTLIFSDVRGYGLSRAKIGDSLSLRLRCGGELLTPLGRPKRTVANLLQEANIAPWRRQRLPFVFSDDKLAALPGVAIATEFAATGNEVGLDCRFEW